MSTASSPPTLRLTRLRATTPAEVAVELTFDRGRVHVVETSTDAPRIDVEELLFLALYGVSPRTSDSDEIIRIRLELDGPHEVVVERDLRTDAFALSIDGRIANDETTQPGEALFGASPAALRAYILFGEGAVESEAELAAAVRTHIGLPPEPRPAEETERAVGALAEVRAKRAEVEAGLAALEAEPETRRSAVVDPPALGDLLTAMEDARQVECRLLDRRLELADLIDSHAGTETTAPVPLPPLLDRLEEIATEITENQRELARIRNR